MKSVLSLFGLLVLVEAAVPQGCGPEEFECANGDCISDIFVCDFYANCRDGSDEPPVLNPDLCPACTPSQFRCDNGRCIPFFYVCDYDNDCRDGSDERVDCPPCPGYTFPCPIGGCIPNSFTCDGVNDCLDWSDETEEECPCSDAEFRCSKPEGPPGETPPVGACIPGEFRCNPEGVWDCPDGSDEANCTRIANYSIRLRTAKASILQDTSKVVYKHRLNAKKGFRRIKETTLRS